MEAESKNKYLHLIELMNAFVTGQSRSRDFVSLIEGEFVAMDLDGDERFSDLQLALAMFGAGEREADETMLAGECKDAFRILKRNKDG